MLHDADIRSALESRLALLRPDSPRKWGHMTSGQMLWHLNRFLMFALGDGSFERQKNPIPLPILRFALLYLPWPKGAPTHPAAVANADHDFEGERARCLELIERFVSQPLDGPWAVDPAFGLITGRFASRLQAKHLNHHFRQFGV